MKVVKMRNLFVAVVCMMAAHHDLLASAKLDSKKFYEQAESIEGQNGIAQYRFPEAKVSLEEILLQPLPFAMTVGTSMSQTHQSDNTASDSFIRSKMQSIIKSMKMDKALAWLSSPERMWFALNSLPRYQCAAGHTIDPVVTVQQAQRWQDQHKIQNMFEDIVEHRLDGDRLNLHHCPECGAAGLQEQPKDIKTFSEAYQNALTQQVKALNVDEQEGCKKYDLPNVRLSIEASDVMVPGTRELDPEKLDKLASFINQMGNPLLFFHHYSNPASIPNLFENAGDAEWFASWCLQVLERCPQITHVCPISQPVAFAYKVVKGQLSPFEREHESMEGARNFFMPGNSKYLEKLMRAQVLTSQKIKELNRRSGRNIQVLFSHQWKASKPKHENGPRFRLESGLCYAADRSYNQAFVNLFRKYEPYFDGIALSVYPGIEFDLWRVASTNSSGIIDYDAAVKSIVSTHEFFPNKDIYIVETGCNTDNPVQKERFIDMTLHACRVARELGIPIKMVIFWGITNDLHFYMEWNAPRGTTHFGPYDALDTQNPVGSINAQGRYLSKLLRETNPAAAAA